MEMDGSLVDWPSELTWFTLDKKAWGGGGNVRPNFRPWGTPAQVRADASVSFTTMWDSERIYFAARIQDNEWHNPAETLDKVWEGDTLYFLLYPLDVPEGESPGIPPYRDHVGVIKDGRVSIDRRMGAFPPTSGFPPGAQGAARMDKAGYTIEWFYPRNVIAPIELKPGGIFRVTVAYGDYDHIEQDGKQVPALKGYTLFFDSFTNLTSDPNFFGRIRLVE
jgi:hypothetical protein